jgi:hypothetical protein
MVSVTFPLLPQAPFDGRNASIVAANIDTNVVDVPEDKTFRITRFKVSNNNAAATRVRFWDTFTDSSGNVHSTVLNPIVLGDYNVQPGETLSDGSALGVAKAIGVVVAQATVAAAFPADVTAGAWGLFE